jgi:hypothetical protein
MCSSFDTFSSNRNRPKNSSLSQVNPVTHIAFKIAAYAFVSSFLADAPTDISPPTRALAPPLLTDGHAPT